MCERVGGNLQILDFQKCIFMSDLNAHVRENPGSTLMWDQKLFTISQMNKSSGAEAYYYVMIDTPNEMPSDLE